MEKFDMLAGYDENTATATGTAAATATQAAPGGGSQLVITGFSVSFGISSTAAGTLVIARNGAATALKNYNLPIGAMAPFMYEFKRPLRVPENQDASAVVTGATTATVRVELFTVTRPVTV